jgi:hypothetical protein
MNRALRGRWVGPIQWGNCVLQGAWLWMRHAKHIVRPVIRWRRGALFPHLLLLTRGNRLWHFLRLPPRHRRFPPLWRGRFHCLSVRALSEFLNSGV